MHTFGFEKFQIAIGAAAAIAAFVTLLKAEALLRGDAGSPKPKIAKPPLCILIVNDIEEHRDRLKAQLRGSGNRLVFAENGEVAIELLKVHPVQLVLLDTNMPGIDEFETARRMREWEQASLCPRSRLIALTADAEDKYVLLAEDAGSDRAAQTPIARDQLLKLAS